VTRGFRELLGEPLWQDLLRMGTGRRYASKSALVRQGAPGGFLLALTAGRVKVLGSEPDGSGLLVALRGPGDLIGEMAARSDTVRNATVEALDDCAARYLPRAKFSDFLTAHGMQDAFNDYLVAKLSETVPYHVRLVHFSARQRTARLLLEVVALAAPEDPARLRVPFSQEAVATALGLSRSTVADQIALLRKDGTLARGPRLLVADLHQLAKHAGVTGVTS
jgi:CRP-like cAMP-binding protein